MSISVNYILEQERKKKQQAQQPVVPAIEQPIQEQQEAQEASKPVEQQLTESAKGEITDADFASKYPNVYKAYSKKNQNESMLPNPNVEAQQEEFPTVQADQPQERYPNKPANWSDEEYEAVRRLKTDEEIQSTFNRPDPNEFLNGIVSNIYKQNTQSPEPYDEEKMKKQQKYAAIGDVLGLFSQAAGAAQGAHVRERKFEESAMGKLSVNQQKLYDNYLTRTDQYNRGLVNAHMQDYIRGEQDWKTTQKEVASLLESHRKEKITLAKQAQKDALEREKLDETKKRNDAYVKDSDRRATIAEKNANTAAVRASTYEKRAEAFIENIQHERNNPKGSKNKAEHTIVVPAHPSDPNAYKNEFGDTVSKIEVSKADREYYANQAMKDKGFIERLGANRPDLAFAASQNNLNSAQRGEIADAYMELEYYSGFGSNPKGASGLSHPKQSIPTPKDPVDVVIETLQEETLLDPDDEFPIVL